MRFETSINFIKDYQTIKDEKKMLLDKLYTHEKRKRHNRINPFQ